MSKSQKHQKYCNYTRLPALHPCQLDYWGKRLNYGGVTFNLHTWGEVLTVDDFLLSSENNFFLYVLSFVHLIISCMVKVIKMQLWTIIMYAETITHPHMWPSKWWLEQNCYTLAKKRLVSHFRLPCIKLLVWVYIFKSAVLRIKIKVGVNHGFFHVYHFWNFLIFKCTWVCSSSSSKNKNIF